LLEAFKDFKHPSEIGPGVDDIHSRSVPNVGEMIELLQLASRQLFDDQLWINLDYSLKVHK
jgi:5-methyltetrahydropteroyltriglutamate--homocysteine methyltransferase